MFIGIGLFSYSREWACVLLEEAGGGWAGGGRNLTVFLVLVHLLRDGKCWHCLDGWLFGWAGHGKAIMMISMGRDWDFAQRDICNRHFVPFVAV